MMRSRMPCASSGTAGPPPAQSDLSRSPLRPSALRIRVWPPLLLTGLTLASCIDPFGGGGIELGLTMSAATVSDPTPITVTMTARNTSGDRIEWGRGSSSCQLNAFAIVGSEERRIDWRSCTEDLARQGLDPGESRTESWMWHGDVLVDRVPTALPPGSYRIFAAAGEVARSPDVTIQVAPTILPLR